MRGGAAVSFGEYGLKVTERGRLTARQTMARRASPATSSAAVIRIFRTSISQKPAEVHGQRQEPWSRSRRARCCTPLAREAFNIAAVLHVRRHLSSWKN
jgi:hypothetical protein